MGKKIEFSEEQKQDIIEMYMNFVPMSKITEKYCVNQRPIYKLLERNNITKRGHRTVDLDDSADDIINLYKEGKTQDEIGDVYGVSGSHIGKLLRKYNASLLGTACKNRKITFSQSDEEEICNMYLSDASMIEIGEIFQCDPGTIVKVLKRHGIERKHRKYQLDEHYFDTIDTPNKAYILGFFYADGCNCKINSVIRMSLQERDVDILEAIRREVSCEKPLRFINGTTKGDNCQNQYELILSSVYLCRVLEEKGMTPRKSLTLTWPTFLSDDLYSHFLRGYIDGDGSISSTQVSFVGTYDFCNSAAEYLLNKIGVQCTIYKDAYGNGVTSNCFVLRKAQSKILLDYLYKDANLYLTRKHDVYISKYCLEENINNTSTNVAS